MTLDEESGSEGEKKDGYAFEEGFQKTSVHSITKVIFPEVMADTPIERVDAAPAPEPITNSERSKGCV